MRRSAAAIVQCAAMSASRFRVPHTLVLLLGMSVLALLASYILPAGAFTRITNDVGREVIVPGTYAALPDSGMLSPWTVLTAIPRGFAASHEIIFFVFIIGGALAVIRATGAIDAALGQLIARLGRRSGLLIAITMLVFTVGSSTLGMAEEYLPFVPVLLTLAIELDMDAVTAIGIMVVGYGVGYGVAAINPFTVVIAQEVAGLAPTSGIGYRLALTIPFALIGIHHVWRYSKRVREDRSASLVADIAPDPAWSLGGKAERLSGTHILVLALAVATLALLVIGIARWHWYLVEMGAAFLGLTLVVAAIARLGADKSAKEFCKGAAELTTTALLIGFARAIQVVLEDGQIIDTIVEGIARPLAQAGPELAAVGMYAIQSICNFFIPSGSGQAYVTMPIMAPIADITGVSRQTAVLAFQFGDGFTNMVVPTNAVLIGILGLARIPYDRWLRFIMPLMVKLWIAGSIALVLAVLMGYE